MNEQHTRLRVNLTTREFEVEGSESFVREYSEKMQNALTASTLPRHKPQPAVQATPEPDMPTSSAGLPATFGEYLHMFPSDIKDMDKILIAGYYAQQNNPENIFTTAAANKLLKEQSIRLSNPTNCIKHNKDAKKVITISKGKFRVSRPNGLDDIQSLLGK
jgi:hypothetical protein